MNDLIKNNVGAICTAIVSICAMIIYVFITIYNQKRQNKIQERITIQKEWIEKVRTYTSTCLYQAANMVSFRGIYGYNPKAPEDSLRQFIEANNQFLASQYSLSLYINQNNVIEREFYDLIKQLFKAADEGHTNIVYNLIPKISEKATEVLKEKIE